MRDKTLSVSEVKQKAARIKLVVFDVDGTLTDGSINMGTDGELFKRCLLYTSRCV